MTYTQDGLWPKPWTPPSPYQVADQVVALSKNIDALLLPVSDFVACLFAYDDNVSAKLKDIKQLILDRYTKEAYKPGPWD